MSKAPQSFPRDKTTLFRNLYYGDLFMPYFAVCLIYIGFLVKSHFYTFKLPSDY